MNPQNHEFRRPQNQGSGCPFGFSARLPAAADIKSGEVASTPAPDLRKEKLTAQSLPEVDQPVRKQPGVIRMLAIGAYKWLKGVDMFKGNFAPPKIPFTEVFSALIGREKNPFKIIEKVVIRNGLVSYAGAPFFDQPAILCADPALALEILSLTDKGRDKSPFSKASISSRALGWLTSDKNIFFASGQAWKIRREAAQPYFLPKNLRSDSVWQSLSDGVQDFVGYLADATRRTTSGTLKIDLNEKMSIATMSISLKAFFGSQIKPDQIEPEILEAFKIISASSVLQMLNPLIDKEGLDLTVDMLPGDLKHAHHVLFRFVDRLILDHKPSSDHPTLLDGLLEEYSAVKPLELQKDLLRKDILVFLLASHETTASLLTWCLRSLSSDPVQSGQLAKDISSRFGAEFPSYEALRGDDHYLDWVYKESTRLFGPVWAVARTANQDTTVKVGNQEYFFPQDCEVVLPLLLMNRSEAWTEKTGLPSTQFRPERFDEERLKREGKTLDGIKSFAFGHGPRNCIGSPFVELEFKSLIVRLFQKFEIEATAPLKSRVIPSDDIKAELSAKPAEPFYVNLRLKQ